jgi:hypothetical protein
MRQIDRYNSHELMNGPEEKEMGCPAHLRDRLAALEYEAATDGISSGRIDVTAMK